MIFNIFLKILFYYNKLNSFFLLILKKKVNNIIYLLLYLFVILNLPACINGITFCEDLISESSELIETDEVETKEKSKVIQTVLILSTFLLVVLIGIYFYNYYDNNKDNSDFNSNGIEAGEIKSVISNNIKDSEVKLSTSSNTGGSEVKSAISSSTEACEMKPARVYRTRPEKVDGIIELYYPDGRHNFFRGFVDNIPGVVSYTTPEGIRVEKRVNEVLQAHLRYEARLEALNLKNQSQNPK